LDSSPEIALVTADEPALIDAVRALLREYAAGLGVDLCFQNFEAELAALPGEYAAPGGALLLALVDGAAAGCVALRGLPDADYPNACEMKRLYVRRAFRRFGLGRALAQQLMDLAAQAGYSCMVLDTLDEMEAARGLYASLGFTSIPPYYYNPIAGAHYFKAGLDDPGTRW
jgi:ribosomal protein S18 acetylase RimI-like enzyme